MTRFESIGLWRAFRVHSLIAQCGSSVECRWPPWRLVSCTLAFRCQHVAKAPSLGLLYVNQRLGGEDKPLARKLNLHGFIQYSMVGQIGLTVRPWRLEWRQYTASGTQGSFS
ncbi:protein of unknown function (plasmid) [Methylocella tundrae]|uniref:Uncharacterized protein n=1 Tax=Methylocella tundrae TaxID=227605 RepID=A0A4U8Z7J0_METTU|nr:protein of unknown function [Methylocella tundrae]